MLKSCQDLDFSECSLAIGLVIKWTDLLYRNFVSGSGFGGRTVEGGWNNNPGVQGRDGQHTKGYRVRMNSIPRGTRWGETVFRRGTGRG